MRLGPISGYLLLLGLFAGCAPDAPIDAHMLAAVTERRANEHVLRRVQWNGREQLFVDYPETAEDYQSRTLALAEYDMLGGVHLQPVTFAEEEGGLPEFALIGTANADGDPAQELVVQLRWQIRHYDVVGTLYEIRVFDQLSPDGGSPVLLREPSEQLGTGCDCDRRDEPDETYAFRTLTDIRGELARLGFAQSDAK